MNEKPHRHKPERKSNETNRVDNTGKPISGEQTRPLDHGDALQWSLWRILISQSRGDGAKVTDVLDTAEEYGIDRFWSSELLMVWLDRGCLKKSWIDNRIVPLRRCQDR